MSKSEHIITFLRRIKTFTQTEGITSLLKVDKENTIEDVFDVSETTGGLICEMDNAINEIIDVLEQYYKATNNKELLNRLNKIK